MTVTNRRALAILIGFALLVAARLAPGVAAQQAPSTPPLHARVFGRLFIRNAMVIYGSGRPPYGPADIVVEDGRIASIGLPGQSGPPPAGAVIDGAGKYLTPRIGHTPMPRPAERPGRR